MYFSPIEIIHDEANIISEALNSMYDNLGNKINENTDEVVLKAVLKYGIKVDKKELIKALEYDRQQYEKGQQDGYKEGYEDAMRDVLAAVANKTGWDLW